MLLAQYDQNLSLVPSAPPTYVSFTRGEQQVVNSAFGDIATIVSVVMADANGIATAAVAAQSPFPHTLFSGYSNGGFGYIPIREAHAEGGYEIEATPFSADAADVLLAESVRILRELAAGSAA